MNITIHVIIVKYKVSTNIYFLVAIEKKKLYHTADKPCIKSPKYDDYKCLESFFAKQRGCQYPWNVYKDVDIPVCSNYAKLTELLKTRDHHQGYLREKFKNYERLAKTNGECVFPCEGTEYTVTTRRWEDWRSGRSLQITLADSIISQEEQYLACDMTCIIGEFGGNLGFFLGGSLLFGFNFIVEYSTKALKYLYSLKVMR